MSDWKQLCLKQESPSPSITSHIDFSYANSAQLFCHYSLEVHIHFAVVNKIQGSAESNPNVWLCSLQCSPIIDSKEFIDLQFKNFKLHMHFLLRRHQTALGAETGCWSCLISSGPSSISCRVSFPLPFLFFLFMMLHIFWSFCTAY